MDRLTETKIVLVVRETRLEDLKARFNTAEQARFYVEQSGGDFSDYEEEDEAYRSAIADVEQSLGLLGRVQTLHRRFLPNFLFGPSDVVVAVGQDGLVANTLKYLDGQPLVAVNPEPKRYDGLLLPFQPNDLAKVVPEVLRGKRGAKAITMAKAVLNNGQCLYAVNDLFIGPKSHGSARYTLAVGDRSERHSSSGVIVSTGLGSTGWFTSLITGATAIAASFSGNGRGSHGRSSIPGPRFEWDADHLYFTVREPFPSRTSSASLVFGKITQREALRIESHMPERGVIFSDGIEADFLDFNSGSKADVQVADRVGRLIV